MTSFVNAPPIVLTPMIAVGLMDLIGFNKVFWLVYLDEHMAFENPKDLFELIRLTH